jgi:hypothetical protein
MRILALGLRAAYHMLIGLYPRAFRATFGMEMRAIFAELLDDTAPRGALALLVVGGRELAGLARGLAREQRAALGQRGAVALTPTQHLLNGATLLLFVLLSGLYTVLDLYGVAWRFPQAAAATIAGGLAIGALVCWAIPRRRNLIVLALFVAAIACVQSIDWNTRKPFLRALGQVHAGMRVAEVDGVMAAYMRSPAVPGQLSASGQVIYRHTDEAWGNSDWGVVSYAQERVVRVEFLPD